jgi:hypothetical protein
MRMNAFETRSDASNAQAGSMSGSSSAFTSARLGLRSSRRGVTVMSAATDEIIEKLKVRPFFLGPLVWPTAIELAIAPYVPV